MYGELTSGLRMRRYLFLGALFLMGQLFSVNAKATTLSLDASKIAGFGIGEEGERSEEGLSLHHH